MNIKKFLVGSAAGALMLGAMAVSAFAANPSSTELIGENWRVFNVMPDTAKFWDINQAQYDGNTLSFPFQQFVSTSEGSFAVYLKNNYNVDLTGKTITAEVNWTSGQYTNRGTGPALDAYVRLEF